MGHKTKSVLDPVIRQWRSSKTWKCKFRDTRRSQWSDREDHESSCFCSIRFYYTEELVCGVSVYVILVYTVHNKEYDIYVIRFLYGLCLQFRVRNNNKEQKITCWERIGLHHATFRPSIIFKFHALPFKYCNKQAVDFPEICALLGIYAA